MMTHSQNCTNLVASFEGCRLSAYQDGGGVLTLGYGHTLGVKEGDTCTPTQALQWLSGDLGVADAAMNRLVTISLTQPQFDALVSFTFNLGEGNLAHSTLLRLLNAGDIIGAANQFLSWVKIGPNESAGLLRRRTAERTMFLSTPEVSDVAN